MGGVFTANADVTIYVNSAAANYYIYAWDASGSELLGEWDDNKTVGSLSTSTVSANDTTYYYYTFKGIDVVYIAFHYGNNQTSDIQVSQDTYFNYYGGTSYWSSADIITVCVNSSSPYYHMYAWNGEDEPLGEWDDIPTFDAMRKGYVDDSLYYYCTFLGYSSLNVIFCSDTKGSQTETISLTPNSYSYFTYSDGSTYTTNKVKQSIFSNDTVYYLVCGESKFKFTPDRVRNGNSLDYNCQNLHLQDFVISDLASGGSYSFHIEDAYGNTYYPGSSYTSFSSLSQITDDTNFDAFYSDSTKYYWIGMEKASSGTNFSMPAGTGKSYTFLWERAAGGIRLLVNGEEFGDAAGYYSGTTRMTVADYYLIGNFASASADDDIDPSTSDNRRMLTPYYYKNGDEYGGTTTDCDSIVYKIEVARPSAGWSELYLDLVNKSDFDTISTWVGNTYAWQRVIRPESSWLLGTVFAYDATALTGGLMRNENSSYQSLNPVVSDTIDSYVFTMNAKTSTYSIRFVSAASNTDDDDEEEETTTKSYLYIFGTAVGSSDGISTTSENWEGANAFKLIYNSKGGYYYYAVIEGTDTTETAIPMVANGAFAFVTDMDFSKGYYTEDGNVPPSLITDSDGSTTYTSTESTKYGANTAGGFYETQYVNMLGTNSTAEAAAYSESIRTITWGLPSGNYYIRFYVGAKNGEYAKNLYTVRRSYRLLRPYANAVTVDNTAYTTFKVFCDSNAVVVPSDVSVLYVPEVTSSLTKASNSDTDNYATYTLNISNYDFSSNTNRVIPANTPVILAMTTARGENSGTKLEADTIKMDYYSNTIIKWTDISSSDTIASGMTPSIRYEAAPDSVDATNNVKNFVFGYKKLSDSATKSTIGFYYPKPGSIAINGAYLSIKSSYVGSDDSSSSPALVFYSDLTETDETDGSETTGINNALAAGDADADGAYYTLQGMRIAKPTVKGIYIHNGKKMIVK